MTRSRSIRISAGVFALALIVAACGDDDDDEAGGADTTSAPATTEAAPATTEAAPATTEAAPPTTAEAPTTTEATSETTSETTAPEGGSAVDLSADCPNPLVIQTDWFAESEHGGLYNMLGDDYTVTADNMRVKGSLVAGGEETGIDLEIRMGGPAIGFEAPRTQIYTDDSIDIAYSNIDAQMLAWEDTPMIAIMAPLEINPQIIMWDADTYPDIQTIADLGTNDVTINIFPGFGFADVFVAQGIWSQDQVDPSYDGSPARFVNSLDIAQQGFASAEPYTYEFEIEEYGKAPAYQLLHDAGYPTYSQTLSVLPEDVEGMAACWEKFIPIAQQAQVDFVNSPDRANAIIVDAVEQVGSFWVYTPGLADYSVQTQLELGLVGNGPDDTLGNFDEARVQEMLDLVREAGAEVPDDLTAAEMFTNDFLDPSIGL
ncbi:MAG TPA: hypothetical protein VFD53_08310 [Ilumatobacter sp.]|jgi:hypothetical protein|nr:hypothetical protein [Ilumatobacter sp.]